MPEIVFQRAMKVIEKPLRLTKKNVELLRLICQGYSNQEMADVLSTHRQSVDTRTYKLRMKMFVPAGGHQKDKIINYVWSIAWNANESAITRRNN